jgi:hypothetical protein
MTDISQLGIVQTFFGERLRASPESLRARAEIVEGKLNDSGSCAAHLKMAARDIEDFKAALHLALAMLSPHEPGDSRAVSNEYVALATIDRGIDDEKSWVVIRDALNRLNAIEL